MIVGDCFPEHFFRHVIVFSIPGFYVQAVIHILAHLFVLLFCTLKFDIVTLTFMSNPISCCICIIQSKPKHLFTFVCLVIPKLKELIPMEPQMVLELVL